MEKLDCKEVLKNIMIKCMCNKNNKDFYYKSLNCEKLERIFKGMDNDFIEFFWNCYCIVLGMSLKGDIE